jgi:hypothetical protein
LWLINFLSLQFLLIFLFLSFVSVACSLHELRIVSFQRTIITIKIIKSTEKVPRKSFSFYFFSLFLRSTTNIYLRNMLLLLLLLVCRNMWGWKIYYEAYFVTFSSSCKWWNYKTITLYFFYINHSLTHARFSLSDNNSITILLLYWFPHIFPVLFTFRLIYKESQGEVGRGFDSNWLKYSCEGKNLFRCSYY